MSDSLIFSLFLPLALAIVMVGLGLHLTLADFRRVLSTPWAVAIALFAQTLLLPPVAFGLAYAFAVPPALALGLILLAASPGGVTANLYSHLARGDVALIVTLTALNSLLCLATLPLWVWVALQWLFADAQGIAPPTRKLMEVGALVLVPVAIGMAIRHAAPRAAERLNAPVKIASTLVLVVLIAAATISEWQTLTRYFAVIGGAVLAFNLISLLTGYGLARLARLSIPQATAIAFEIGIHNGTLAIYIALAVLDIAEAAVAPAMYSLAMYLTGAVFAWWLLRAQENL